MATMAPQGTTERQTACKAFRMRGQAASEAFNRCHMQPLEYIGRERENRKQKNWTKRIK